AAARPLAPKAREGAAAPRQRPIDERTARVRKHVEDHEHGRPLRGQLSHPALRWVNALEKIVEGELTVHGDHDLRVEDEGRRGHGEDGLHDFRKIAGEGLSRLGLELDRTALAEDEAAKAIPLRLVLPAW